MASPYGGQHGQYLSSQRPRMGFRQGYTLLNQLLRALDMYRRMKGRQKSLLVHEENLERIANAEISKLQEDTYLKTFGDAVRDGFIDLEGNGKGSYCGRLNGHNFYIDKDYHFLILGRAGAYKTTAYCNPMAIELAKSGQSLFMPCIKIGEPHEELAEGIERIQGKPPVLIDALSPLDSGIRINPLDDLVDMARSGAPIIDRAKSKAQLFREHPGSGNNAWIGKAAIRLIWCVLPFLAVKSPESCNPATLADISLLPHDDLQLLLNDMIRSDACDGFVSDMARRWQAEFREDTEQFQWVMADMFETFSAYTMGGAYRDFTCETSYRIGNLKQKAGAVFSNDHDWLMHAHPGHFRVMNDYMIQELATTDGDVYCNILWDEFPQYPALETVIRALRLYRSKKVLFKIFAQDANSFKGFDKWGGYDVFAENCIQIVLSCDGLVAERMSKKAGRHAVSIPNGGSSYSVDMTANRSASEVMVDNLPVSVIAQGMKGKAIVDTRTDGIYILDRPPFWEVPEFAEYIKG
tara:strand:+ start:7902 stop:9467 length:1566 start_codon:yes stop_codon:yes gene_type:complete